MLVWSRIRQLFRTTSKQRLEVLATMIFLTCHYFIVLYSICSTLEQPHWIVIVVSGASLRAPVAPSLQRVDSTPKDRLASQSR